MKVVSFGISAISVLCWFSLSVSTNENYISSELSMEFISRGCYGVSGYIYLNKDFLDDNLMGKVNIGYNSRNYKSFAATPFHVGPMDALSLANRYYKKYLMSTLANCSNFPQSDADFENLEAFGKNNTFNKCTLKMENPLDFRSGFYCGTFNLTKNIDGETPFNAFLKYIIQIDNYF